MRDRVIELIKQGDKTFADKYTGKVMSHIDEVYEFVADYLIANGVDIPLCKVGYVVYTIEGCNNRPEKLVVTAVHQYEKHTSITALSKSQKEYFYEDKDFGEVVFLTKEEAEQKLKGGVE